jgi:hypothetical protein
VRRVLLALNLQHDLCCDSSLTFYVTALSTGPRLCSKVLSHVVNTMSLPSCFPPTMQQCVHQPSKPDRTGAAAAGAIPQPQLHMSCQHVQAAYPAAAHAEQHCGIQQSGVCWRWQVRPPSWYCRVFKRCGPPWSSVPVLCSITNAL